MQFVEPARVLRCRTVQAVAALTLVGGGLRFSTLGLQSYWYNEAATVVLVKMGLGDMLAHVPKMEGNPPLYYVIAWLWAKPFGTGEVGLRAASACIGTATIPAAYAVAARLATRRAGVVVAALTACSPLLVWFSQEARPYALLALLAALSFLYFLRALDERRPRDLTLWAAISVLALATHYFALFVVGPEAVWLLATNRSRRHVLACVAAVAAMGIGLLPLALTQSEPAKTSIPDSFGERIVQLPKQFLMGFGLYTPAERLVVAAAGVAAVYGAWLGLTRTDRGERRGVMIAAGLGLTALLAVSALALLGLDYLNTRNMIAVWLPFAVVVGIGLGAARAGTAGVAIAAALCAMFLAAVVTIDVHRPYQRDDWRGAVHALGRGGRPRAVVVTPPNGVVPLKVYLPRARVASGPAVTVEEIDLLSIAQRSSPGHEVVAPPVSPAARMTQSVLPAFRLVGTRPDRMYTVIRLRAPTPVSVPTGTLHSLRPANGESIVELEP